MGKGAAQRQHVGADSPLKRLVSCAGRRHGVQHVGDPADAAELGLAEARVVPAAGRSATPTSLWAAGVSPGTAFLLQVRPAASRLSDAAAPVSPRGRKSATSSGRIRAAGDDGDAALHQRIGEGSRIGEALAPRMS